MEFNKDFEIEKNLSKMNGTLDKLYDKTVNALIRKKYSLSAELSVSRQRTEKPEEWEAFYSYCEECKKVAKDHIYTE